jgi:hypothetical protein
MTGKEIQAQLSSMSTLQECIIADVHVSYGVQEGKY